MRDGPVFEVHSSPEADVPVEEDAILRALRVVLDAEGAEDGRISVAFVTDSEIARLNEQYLHHEGPTDVISFPLHEPGTSAVGDIYIGIDQARRQADELGIPLAEELLRLAIHGTLHVLGYDHPDGDERFDSPMYRRQEALLARALPRAADA